VLPGEGLTDKRAVVIGAGQGIGRQSALALASAGASVVCADIRAERGKEVVKEIVDRGGCAVPFSGDMTKRIAVQQLQEASVAALGGVDVVVDIIGQALPGGLLDMSDETWNASFKINLLHNFLVTQIFGVYMRDAQIQGSFVHMGSAAGYVPSRGYPAYSAAKAALRSLIHSSSVELAPHAIRINGIAPGAIDTPRLRTDPNGTTAPDPRRVRNIPLGRLGSTQDVANLVVFLASDLASYVTGQTYLVDGGVLSMSPFA